MQGRRALLSSLGPNQDTRPLTLDEILAMDVPNFQQDHNRLRLALDGFIKNPLFKNTSIENQAVPAAQGLQTWVGLFESSMRSNRLPGALKARVCFAERGMFYLIYLFEALDNQMAILGNEQQKTDKPELKQELETILDSLWALVPLVLGHRDEGPNGLTMMRNWLATLVDVVPLELRSPHTPLIPENIEKLDEFIQ